jgi:hypothetical protein
VIIAKDIQDNPGGFINWWNSLDLSYNRKRIIKLLARNANGNGDHMHLKMDTLRDYIPYLKPISLAHITPLYKPEPEDIQTSETWWSLITNLAKQRVKVPAKSSPKTYPEFSKEQLPIDKRPVMYGTSPIQREGYRRHFNAARWYGSPPWQKPIRWMKVEEEKEVQHYPWRSEYAAALSTQDKIVIRVWARVWTYMLKTNSRRGYGIWKNGVPTHRGLGNWCIHEGGRKKCKYYGHKGCDEDPRKR